MLNFFKPRPYLHQYLNLPVDINLDLSTLNLSNLNEVLHVEIDPVRMVNQEFVEFINNIPGIRISFWEAFYTPPGKNLPIHCDYNKITDAVKLNISYGQKDSKIIWWKLKSGKSYNETSTAFSQNYLTADENNCTILHSAFTNKPSLVQSGILHSTYNPGPEGRWTLSLPLYEKNIATPITFELAVAIFSNYLSF